MTLFLFGAWVIGVLSAITWGTAEVFIRFRNARR